MTNKELIEALSNGNETVFQQLFYQHYESLYRAAFRYVGDQQIAEELVQDAFVNFWENRKKIVINKNIESYLFVSVRNLSFNFLKSRYAKSRDLMVADTEMERMPSEEETTDTKDLEVILQKAITALPEKCRIIFNLSRNNGLTYQEIADELGITKETVKSQIKIAMKKLRETLKEHWYLILYFYLI